jgi:hypothetical protein
VVVVACVVVVVVACVVVVVVGGPGGVLNLTEANVGLVGSATPVNRKYSVLPLSPTKVYGLVPVGDIEVLPLKSIGV